MTKPLLKAEIETGGRVRLVAFDQYGKEVQVDELDYVRGNWTITVGIEATFEILTKHFSDAYTVSTDNGVVKIDGNYVKYTAAFSGEGGFWLNGTFHPVTVLKNQPKRPVITLPANNAVVTTVYPAVASSAFAVDDGTITHQSTRWQVANDLDFQEIVLDVTSSTQLTSFIASELKRGNKYYVRVMYIGLKA